MRRQTIEAGPGVITRLARAAAMHRCVALTRAERLMRAVFWIALGFAAGGLMVAARERYFPAPINPKQPEVELKSPRMTVYRFPFEYLGTEIACHLVLRHEEETWLVKC